MEEKCTNPKFTCEDKTLVFGTWEGNIYGYCLETKKIVKQFSLENHVFGLAHSGKYDDYLYFKTTKIPDENSNYALDYIFEYDAMKKNGSKVTFTEKINPYEIHGITGSGLKGLALFKEKLAITTAYYGKSEEENGRLIGEAKTYVFDILSKRVTLIKDSYKIRSLFDNFSCIVWNNKGNKLAFIGLHEVYIIDTYNNSEVIIPFDGATSVEFSNCDTGIAVGGDKAKLFKIE
jgi:hypothetical protein